MNRLARSALCSLVLASGVACGGDVGSPVGSTGSGGKGGAAAGTGGSGGAAASAGATSAGGASTGGTSAGGRAGSAGSTSVGGSSASGGSTSVGGTSGSAGTSSVGGSSASAGSSSVGGASAGGGSTSVGGTSGSAGTTSLGGSAGSAGSSSVGGSSAIGGSGGSTSTAGSGGGGGAQGGSCAATTLGPDPCDCAPGKKIYYWDGQSCASTLACCPSASGTLYDSESACRTAHASCGETPTCSPTCANGCAYTDKRCGTDSTNGVCLPTPKCSSDVAPVCGCDGVVYANECLATSAGVDTSVLGGCVAPAATFACGDHFCTKGQQYCQRLASDVGGFADGFACKPLPEACSAPGEGGGPCACFENEPCGSICQPNAEGYITLTCPGG